MEQDENTLDVQEEIQENETQETTEVVEPEKDWKAEAAKWQRLAQKAQKKPQTLPQEQNQPKGVETDSLIDNLALIKDYSQDDLANIRKEAKDLGVDLFKFVQSNTGKTFIEKMRSEKKAADTTLTPSNKGFTFNGKPINDVLLGDASKAEKQAAWEARVGSLKKKGSNL